MTPLETLVMARRADVRVSVDAVTRKLVIEADEAPPADILAALKEHRDRLVEMLTLPTPGDPFPADSQYLAQRQADLTPPPICGPCGRRQHWPDVVCSPELCPGWRDPDPRYPIAPAYIPSEPTLVMNDRVDNIDRVVNIKTGAGCDVYIGRANSYYGLPESKWHNPFHLRPGATDAERRACIDRFRAYLHEPAQAELLEQARPELAGKTLGCYCRPKPCHGDVLVELSEGGPMA